MGTLQAESGEKRDMDDSGCVEDAASTPVKKCQQNGYCGSAELLDLSDDVLLYILKYCSPQDLKALGYTCPRLGTLILDRTLWQTVDARDVPCGRNRLRWMLDHCLSANTKELSLTGFAKMAEGCEGLINRTRQEVNEAEKADQEMNQQSDASESSDTTSAEGEFGRQLEPPYPLFRQHARLHINAHPLPRYNISPIWPEDLEPSDKPSPGAPACPGPVLTLCAGLLQQLRARCVQLARLRLDYCNIDCRATSLRHFPPTLKMLSLKGTKCFNQTNNKSFLYQIQDYLPLLEELDVSECQWLEPAALLPLSKLPALARLRLRDCPRFTECVAYCSLATRYGFQSLQLLDLRGCPVGDSEVSGLGWVRTLQELYISAPTPPRPAAAHAHCRGEGLPAFSELHAWEIQEPEYFKSKRHATEGDAASDTTADSLDDPSELLRNETSAPGSGFYCPDGVRIEVTSRPRDQGDQPERSFITVKRRVLHQENGNGNNLETNGNQPGPSRKRARGDDERPTYITISSIRNVRRNNDEETSKDDAEAGSSSKQPRNDDERPTYITISSIRNVRRNNDEERGREENKARSSPNQPRTGDERPTFITISSMRNVARNNDEERKKDDAEAGSSPKQPRTDDERPTYITISSMGNVTRNNDEASENSAKLNEADAGPSPKQPRADDEKPTFITISCKRNITRNNDEKPSEASENESSLRKQPRSDDDKPLKYITIRNINVNRTEEGSSKKPDVNEGASTSKTDENLDRSTNGVDKSEELDQSKEILDSNVSNTSDCEDDVSNCSKANNRGSSPSNSENSVDFNDRRKARFERFVRFRQNQDPVVINCPVRDENQNQNQNQNENQEAEPRHRIFYVTMGQQMHPEYRLLPNIPVFQDVRNRRIYPPTSHMDAPNFVTDTSIFRFGRSENENVNYIHIGPNGPIPAGGVTDRPSRSNLRVLSVTGYRHITDRSLVHLATAAPFLRHVDFSRTNVTERGVENFKSLRPDVEVVYSPFVDKNEATD